MEFQIVLSGNQEYTSERGVLHHSHTQILLNNYNPQRNISTTTMQASHMVNKLYKSSICDRGRSKNLGLPCRPDYGTRVRGRA